MHAHQCIDYQKENRRIYVTRGVDIFKLLGRVGLLEREERAVVKQSPDERNMTFSILPKKLQLYHGRPRRVILLSTVCLRPAPPRPYPSTQWHCITLAQDCIITAKKIIV